MCLASSRPKELKLKRFFEEMVKRLVDKSFRGYINTASGGHLVCTDATGGSGVCLVNRVRILALCSSDVLSQ